MHGRLNDFLVIQPVCTGLFLRDFCFYAVPIALVALWNQCADSSSADSIQASACEAMYPGFWYESASRQKDLRQYVAQTRRNTRPQGDCLACGSLSQALEGPGKR
jgi:hypothetical protein